jgi:hypothetical protein
VRFADKRKRFRPAQAARNPRRLGDITKRLSFRSTPRPKGPKRGR